MAGKGGGEEEGCAVEGDEGHGGGGRMGGVEREVGVILGGFVVQRFSGSWVGLLEQTFSLGLFLRYACIRGFFWGERKESLWRFLACKSDIYCHNMSGA